MNEGTLSDEYIDEAILVDDKNHWCGAPEHMWALRELRQRRDAQKGLPHGTPAPPAPCRIYDEEEPLHG